VQRIGGKDVVVSALEGVQNELRVLRLLSLAAAASASPPRIVILEAALCDARIDELYFVLRLADGGPCMRYDEAAQRFHCPFASGGGPMPLATARSIFLDVMTALVFVHDQGVAHRDIKPENVLLGSDGHARLCDFGAAAYFGLDKPAGHGESRDARNSAHSDASESEEGSDGGDGGSAGGGSAPCRPRGWVCDTAGTFLFLCPEAANGEGYSAFSADVWAAGVLLYTMLFGAVPFGAGSGDALAVFEAIKSAPLALPWADAARDAAGGRGAGAAAAADLLQRLFARDAAGPARLSDARGVLSHAFLAGDWASGAPACAFPRVDPATLERYVTAEMSLAESIASFGAAQQVADVAAQAAAAVASVAAAAAADEPPLAALAGADMVGFLLKRGRAFKTWRPRFFVLSGTSLCYYRAKAAEVTAGAAARNSAVERVANGEAPLGRLDLAAAPALIVRTPKAEKPFRFSLTVPGRTLMLQASSERDLGAWEAAFVTLPFA
jgi:serine/threonine protein kinase